MIELDYFQEVNTSKFKTSSDYLAEQLGSVIKVNPTNLDGVDIVIFDVNEDRGSINNSGCAKAGNEIRKHLYELFKGDWQPKIADLGTILPGDSVSDTYFAVQECISYCLKQQKVPIILGGSQDLVYANYLAYTKQEQSVNLVSIDARFALGQTDDKINSNNVFGKVILHQPNVLFNFSNLGYQTYLVSQTELGLLEELFFDGHRLGELKANIQVAEPILRNADFINFNMSAIAYPHAPANNNSSPNGLSAEQACQLCKYAGLSDKLTSFGLYELNPSIADNGQTAHLAAQMLWYFIDGFYNRKGDLPSCNKREYMKYTVTIEDGNQELIFYKSPKSDRWWMEVPYHANFSKKYERHLMLPCSYEDYLTATQNEIPERWFQTFKKLK